MALQRTAGPGVRAGSSRPARATRARTCATLPRVRGRVGWGPAFRSQCGVGSPPSQPSPVNGERRQAQRACVDGAGGPPRRGARANAALPRVRGRVGWGRPFRSQRAIGLPPSRPSPVNGGRRQAQYAAVDDASRQASRCGARANAALPRLRGRVGWGRTFRSLRAVGLPPSRPFRASGGRRRAQCCARPGARRP